MRAVADSHSRQASMTPAGQCLLTIAAGLPYFLVALVFFDQALAQPDPAAITRRFAMTLMRDLFAVICAVLVLQAAWLWRRRHDPAPRDYSRLSIVLLSALALTSAGVATGSFNSPVVLAAVLALVVGLALHPMRIVLPGFLLSIILPLSYQTLVRAGIAPYAPLLVPGSFLAETGWWRHLRDIWLYGGVLEGILLIFWVFSRADRQARLLVERARSDGLTGLANRAHFLTQLEAAVVRRDRDGQVFTLVLCNVDWFNLINDSYGHVVGDDVLRRLGRLLAEACRPDDVAARLGGDEFALLLATGGRSRASRLCKDLHLDVFAHELTVGESRFRVTVSLIMVEASRGTAEDLVHQANARLQFARRTGRNCIVMMQGAEIVT